MNKIKSVFTVLCVNTYLLLNSVSLKASGIFEIEDPLAGIDDYKLQPSQDAMPAINKFVEFAMVSINGLAGIGMMTSIIAFGINAFKFSKANNNKRADAIENLFTIAITTACLGSVPLIMYLVSLFMNI